MNNISFNGSINYQDTSKNRANFDVKQYFSTTGSAKSFVENRLNEDMHINAISCDNDILCTMYDQKGGDEIIKFKFDFKKESFKKFKRQFETLAAITSKVIGDYNHMNDMSFEMKQNIKEAVKSIKDINIIS